MYSQTQINLALTLALALALSGCPDPAPPKATVDGGTEGGGLIINEDGAPPEGGAQDMGLEDQGPVEMDPDMMTPDMDEPDMAAPDMDPPPPPLYDGGACTEDSECLETERCLFEVCRFDLRPTVYRMNAGEVFEPSGTTGNLLELLLNNSVADLEGDGGLLNLMFEPGFYEGEQAYWFIGNGLPGPEGYVYRRNFPIQNFLGSWLSVPQEDGTVTPMWQLDGLRPFILAVPTGIVMPADTERYGESFQCTTTFPTTVNVTITPERDEDGGPYPRIKVKTEGYLKRADIEQINILFNGSEISFIDYFDGVELLDLDGDGEAQEYAFHLEVMAAPISFNEELARPDRLDLRDPSPVIEQPPECEGR